MITFHLTPYQVPALSDKMKWDHIEDKRSLTNSGWHDVRVALIEAYSGEQVDADFQVDIALLKDKNLYPYLNETKGQWQVDTSHMEHHEWLQLLEGLW